MSENNQQNEAPEADIILDKEEYLEAARALFHTSGPIWEYPESIHQPK